MDLDLCFCPRWADVMPITKIHLFEKAREGLWITAKVRRRKNIAVGRTRTI
jgi:hypothetical protein